MLIFKFSRIVSDACRAIIWATGGNHPSRRWYRQIISHCPNVDISKIRIRAVNLALEHWDYQSIIALYRREKIESKQVEIIAENVIQEILFDLAQSKHQYELIYIRDSQVILDLPITFTSTDLFIKRAEEQLQAWYSAGLTNCYPDLAPIVQQPANLQKLVSPAIFKNFITFVNGKHSLRDLSVLLKQDIIIVTNSLISHTSKGLIQLREIPDLPLPGTVTPNQIITIKPHQPNGPLIACIDDSS